MNSTDADDMGLETDSAETAAVINLPDNANYLLDTDSSTLKWAASKIVSNFHEGTADIQSGNLIRENGVFTSGEYVIDITTLVDVESNQALIGHLKSADFFNIEMYPTSMFKITNIEKMDENYEVTGDLTIKDVTNEISFNADLSQKDGNLNIGASFEIDRTKWGLDYLSGSLLEQLGEKAIKDQVYFELDLVFVEQ
mgnify:CR=1 FL=1